MCVYDIVIMCIFNIGLGAACWPGRSLRSRWTLVATSSEAIRWSMLRGSAIMWDVTSHVMWEPSALAKASWLLVDAFKVVLVNCHCDLTRAGSTTSPLTTAFLMSRGPEVTGVCRFSIHRFHPQELHLSPGPLQGGTPLGALPAKAAGRAARGDAGLELHGAVPGAAGRGAATAEGIQH